MGRKRERDINGEHKNRGMLNIEFYLPNLLLSLEKVKKIYTKEAKHGL